MPSMTFQEEDGYIVCYIDGKEVSRAKKAADGTSTADVINIINDQIKANPTLAGTEPNLEGLEVSGDKYVVPQGSGGTVLMSDIEDANGNKRFVEGAGTTNTISDVTFSYCKWSLSGTHIMFVCAGTMVNNVAAQTFCTFTIPQWIHDKIVGIGRYGEIELKETTAYGINSSSSAPVNFMLQKSTNNPDIIIKLNDTFSRSSVLGFRIQFDLLIDTE